MSEYDYIVIGSGAGGGPLAANLARAGFKVALMEAGGDPCSESDMGRMMYEVPIFHGLSTEYKECAWDYFVNHYSDAVRQHADTKYQDLGGQKNGIWYPRAGTLGGCTAHNAMITVIPQDEDWDGIAALTGDSSWKSATMRGYFERMENCTYVPHRDAQHAGHSGFLATIKEIFDKLTHNKGEGHGFNGWLTTSESDPKMVLRDPQVIAILLKAVKEALWEHVGDPGVRLASHFDPNDIRNARNSPEGLAFTPMAVVNGKRNGPREYIRRTEREFPGNLTLKSHALATRILFDGKKAIGVEYLDGKHLYRADPQANGNGGQRSEIYCSKEVIVAGGAFNTPQLLKLSGVGPRAELDRWNIPVIVDLPGVGENLQDRYEVGVVSRFKRDFALLEDVPFAPPAPDTSDPTFDLWKQGKGLYASNGSLIGIIKRSTPDKPGPDLYIFGLPGFFKGYEPGYSKSFERHRNVFTWAILKAHTNNTAGFVKLRSADPLDTPLIDFRYFDEGSGNWQEDLDAVVHGVEFVRSMNAKLRPIIEEEEIPGPGLQGDQLRKFIKDEAWGHHASCTAKIGADDDGMAVLDSRFRVRGTKGLRVVDASVFPRIPGHFIVSAVYMISEKAFDVIKQDA